MINDESLEKYTLKLIRRKDERSRRNKQKVIDGLAYRNALTEIVKSFKSGSMYFSYVSWYSGFFIRAFVL